MRRVTFTRTVTLSAAYDYERAIEDGGVPVLHEVTFKEGESVDLYEWGWTETITNFATDNPKLMARVRPGMDGYDVVCILEVPYDCHHSEPAGKPAVEEPFRQKTPVILDRPPMLSFPPDSGSPDPDDVVDSSSTAADTVFNA